MSQRLSVLFLLLAAACGGSDSTGPSGINGSYDLVSVNGAALPFTTSATSGSFTASTKVTAGTVLLVAPMSYLRSLTRTQTVTGSAATDASVVGKGDYSQTSATQVQFISGNTDDFFFPSTGTVGNGQITLVISGNSYLFTRK